MNTATNIEPNIEPKNEPENESKPPFLTPKEEEDFKIWMETKIHSGSKPYDADGKSV